MTDHPTTPTDDELSLAIDGEADAELLARIDASPEAQARLEELRAASALVAGATVPPLGDDVVDDLVSTALDTPIAPEHRADGRRRGAAPWLVAASVVLLMAVGLSLVWAGRSSDEDQASASFSDAATELQETSGSSGGDAAFSESAEDRAEAPPAGGHGAPTTVASASPSSADVPVVFLGSFSSGDRLREATATSFADALRSSDTAAEYDGSGEVDDRTNRRTTRPSDEAIDRCAEQLQVTLKLDAGPIQTGYATVDGRDVLVYEFSATSARTEQATTLVAAVGVDACDEVVIFER